MNTIETAFKLLNPTLYEGEPHLGKDPYVLIREARGIWSYTCPQKQDSFPVYKGDRDKEALWQICPTPPLLKDVNAFSGLLDAMPEYIVSDEKKYYLARIDYRRWAYVMLDSDECLYDSNICKSEAKALVSLLDQIP